MNIDYRYSNYSDEFFEEPIQIGMVIAGKVNEDNKYINPSLGYFGDFSYIVVEIKEEGIYTKDLAHNNLWFIRKEELPAYELVMEFHPNNDDVDSDFINKALIG